MKKITLTTFILSIIILSNTSLIAYAGEDGLDDLSDLGLDDLFDEEELIDPLLDTETEESTNEKKVAETTTEEVATDSDKELIKNNKTFQTTRISKSIYSFSDRVPGAIKAKGATFLSISSRKARNKYLPCKIGKEKLIMSKLARLKLMQGAPITCRENIGFKTIPYRMYRK